MTATITSKRTYGYNTAAGLADMAHEGYQVVRLGIVDGMFAAVDADTGEVVWTATVWDETGVYFRGERLATRWQRVAANLLAREG